MIIGLISILFDYFFLMFFHYNIDSALVFPMFSLVFLISHIYFKNEFKIFFIIFVIYSILSGIIFLPLTLLLVVYYLQQRNNLNYYDLIIIFLFLYDFIFYFFIYQDINNIHILINKIVITIPINLVYAKILYVLNNKKIKYKLV